MLAQLDYHDIVGNVIQNISNSDGRPRVLKY